MYRNHLEKLVRNRLDDVLVDEGILDRARMEAAQAEQDQSGKLLSDVLIDSGTVDEWDLARLIVSHYALPFVDPKLYSIPPHALDLLPLDWCRSRSVLPLDQFGQSIALGCVEVPSAELLQEIVEKTGCTSFLYVVARRTMREVIDELLKRKNRGGHGAETYAVPRAGQAQKAAAEPELPPLDLPRISMQLDASAASVSQASRTGADVLSGPPARPAPAPQAPPRPRIERPGHPAAPAVPAVAATPSAAPRVVFPSSGTPRAAPSPPPSPAPARLAAAAPSPAPAGERPEPSRPRVPGRAAPVLPSVPAAGAGGAKPAAAPRSGWESIFDLGDDAVKRSTPGDERRKSRV